MANGGDVFDGECGVGVSVDLTNDLFGVPRRLDFTVRVTGSEEADELRSSLIGESLISPGQEVTDPSESALRPR